MHKVISRTLLFMLLILLFSVCPVHAYNSSLSETVNAVFARLEGVDFIESENNKDNNEEQPKVHVEPEKEEPALDEQYNNQPALQEQASKKEGHANQSSDSIVIKPIPELRSDSIMHRIQEGGTIPLDELTGEIDSLGTKLYNTIARNVVGVAPIVLVIGAFVMLFTKGKIAGFLLLLVAALFIILNAPEIVAVLINFIANVFR